MANTTGTYLDETPRSEGQSANFAGNLFALNDVALRLHGLRRGLEFLDNDFTQNARILDVEGGGDALAWLFQGNYYSERRSCTAVPRSVKAQSCPRSPTSRVSRKCLTDW